jgi:hypothetical protein
MFNRIALCFTALTLFSAAPAFATGAHAEKGASGNGDSPDVTLTSTGQTVDGIPIENYTNFGTYLEIFQIPTAFTSGTPYLLTFNSALPTDGTAAYGVFDCDNGTGTAIDASGNPMANGSDCTQAPLNTSDQYVSFVEGTNTAKITFLASVPGANASTTYYFWTTATDVNGDFIGNLASITPAGSTGTVPEPGTFGLLASGLLAIALFRRRTTNA